MRVAVLDDIHGNLPALDAALADIRRAGVDRIVVGGDVLPGPMPRETLDRLLSLDVPVDCLYGNGEVAILEALSGRVSTFVPETYRPMIRWNADQLTSSQREELKGWPMTVRLTIPPLGEVLFCHATPRDWNECFVRTTPEEKLWPIFDAANAAVVVCGHTHMQFDRMVGKTRVVNAGSVGIPFGRTGVDWLLLGPEVDLRHIAYDMNAAVERFRETTCPLTEEFIVPAILSPQSEEQMLQIFSHAELAG
jgi:predicted phosphodiesterase